jgi:glycosyltransferase 2 family protein
MLKRERGLLPAFAPKAPLSRISFYLSLAVFIAAALMLYHILRGIDPDKLVAALKATKPHTLLAAGCFVAAGYLTLTCYDLFALRTIGRADLPYRLAALGGFTSYSVGHNIGASVFSGGAVRYHIYSSHGLSVVDVTKICFIAGLTFWLGNVAVLGLGILYAPEAARALDQLPLWANRGLAVFLLLLLGAYIAWVSSRPRLIGREKWHLVLPGGGLTLLQIMIGIVDLGCCAAAMYMLMPPQPNLGFVTVSVIFVAATLLGFASHAPGGLGVFDTAMLIALWQFKKEELVAGLLLFRLLYYIVPFVLSLFILGIREVLVGRGDHRAAAPASAAIAEAGEYLRRQSDAT